MLGSHCVFFVFFSHLLVVVLGLPTKPPANLISERFPFHHAKLGAVGSSSNHAPPALSCKIHPPNTKMSTQREGVNPLRPYYRPPTIGEAPDPTSAAAAAASQPKPFARHAANATSERYASKARDIFSDIDYKDYISEPSPSVVQTVRDLVDELLWKYTSVLMAQPFEVAKTVLQVRSHDDLTLAPPASEQPTPLASPVLEKKQPVFGKNVWDEPGSESDSDLDEPAYFTSNIPTTPTPSQPKDARHHEPSPPRTPAAKQPLPPHQLNIRRPDSLMEVIGQLWQKEGAWGVWKGSNATFLYSILSSLFENWSRSALSALFNVPDLGVKEDIDRLIDIASPYPWASLCVAAAAAVATGLILAPLDLVRTRYVMPCLITNCFQGDVSDTLIDSSSPRLRSSLAARWRPSEPSPPTSAPHRSFSPRFCIRLSTPCSPSLHPWFSAHDS